MAPETHSIEYSAALTVLPDDDVKAYREVTLCYTGDFAFNPHLSHNKSLGLATVGKPLESVKGPVLILVSLYTRNEEGEFVGKMSDATPGELPKVLRHIEGAEYLHTLDPSHRIARMLEETGLGDSDSDDSHENSNYEDEDASEARKSVGGRKWGLYAHRRDG